MDLGELSELTGISARRLRYCLDHELIPGLKLNLQTVEVGRARRFSQDAGFGIACTALLQELGLPHPTIRLFLQNVLDEEMSKGYSVLQSVLEHAWPAEASLGDGEQFRMIVRDHSGKDLHNSGWQVLGKKSRKPAPRVIIHLDLRAIRQQVIG